MDDENPNFCSHISKCFLTLQTFVILPLPFGRPFFYARFSDLPDYERATKNTSPAECIQYSCVHSIINVAFKVSENQQPPRDYVAEQKQKQIHGPKWIYIL